MIDASDALPSLQQRQTGCTFPTPSLHKHNTHPQKLFHISLKLNFEYKKALL